MVLTNVRRQSVVKTSVPLHGKEYLSHDAVNHGNAIGKGHSVKRHVARWEVDSIFGFASENDALEWNKEK